MPVVYVLAAAQTGVRRSDQTTFGGLWSAAAIGALLTMTGVFTRLNSTGARIVLNTISAVMPLLGTATAFELTAEPAPSHSERRASRRVAATFAMVPSINAHEHGALDIVRVLSEKSSLTRARTGSQTLLTWVAALASNGHRCEPPRGCPPQPSRSAR